MYRDVYILTSGYGTDILHYLSSFNELILLDSYDFFEVNKIGLFNTGSSEPLFWLFAFLCSRFSVNPHNVWFLLVMLSLIFSAVNFNYRAKNNTILILLVFVSSITFFSYAGSAVRQFVAIPFLIGFINNHSNRKSYIYLLLGVAIHFSFIFIIAVFFAYKIVKRYKSDDFVFARFSIYIFLCGIGIYFLSNNLMSILPVDNSLSGKITARMQDNESGFSWLIQYTFEISIFFSIMIYYKFKKKLDEHDLFIFRFLMLFTGVVFGLSLLSGISDRIYRYSYIFYLVAISVSINRCSLIKRQLISLVLLLSITIYSMFLFETRYNLNYGFESFLDTINFPLYN
jgi:hypothetical protein